MQFVRSVANVLPFKQAMNDRYRRWSIDHRLPPMPMEAVVPLDEATDVMLLFSRMVRGFTPQVYIQELAFAHELAARNRTFAITADPGIVFEKSVMWFLPGKFVSPVLWNYSRQVWEFVVGMESQGNRLFCSSEETAYWENKAHMHRKLAEFGIPTPKTVLLTRENWHTTEFDIEPVLIKQEHSAGSAGIRHFEAASTARDFVSTYQFRPSEVLIMQAVVPGATKDMRVTAAGHAMIRSATYWRAKVPAAGAEWTTTATTYGSIVEHDHVPESVGRLAAQHLEKLGLRTAGLDLMWSDDDTTRDPLVLELSPYYQPNPPKATRYAEWSYKTYKSRPYVQDGYFLRQYGVFREIASAIFDEGLY